MIIQQSTQTSPAAYHDGVKGVEPGLDFLVREIPHFFTNSPGGHRSYWRLENFKNTSGEKGTTFILYINVKFSFPTYLSLRRYHCRVCHLLKLLKVYTADEEVYERTL